MKLINVPCVMDPRFRLPARLTLSRLPKVSSSFAKRRRASSLNVRAVELCTTAAEPSPRPSAPKASFLRDVIPDTIFSRSVLETRVEVKDNFSRVVLARSGGGCFMPVNDISKRCMFGHMVKNVVMVASVTDVCRSLSVRMLGSRKLLSVEISNSRHSFATDASVYRTIIEDESCLPT